MLKTFIQAIIIGWSSHLAKWTMGYHCHFFKKLYCIGESGKKTTEVIDNVQDNISFVRFEADNKSDISNDNHYTNNEFSSDEEDGKDKTEKENKAAKRKLKKQKQKGNRKIRIMSRNTQDDDKLKEALRKEAENAKKRTGY